MSLTSLHQATQDAHRSTKLAEATLMHWVADAQKALASGKVDGPARARLGELVLNACHYLTEREAAHRKVSDRAQSKADAAQEMHELQSRFKPQ